MIIKRDKQFSLRERNRVRSKGDSAKDQLEERNLGEIPETEHNTFHNSRPTTHLEHTRTRLYRNFSKTNEEKDPEDVTIRIGHYDNKKRLGDLTDKQLKNIASWNKKTDEQKKNVRKNNAIVIGSQAAVGGLLGESIAKSGKKLKGAAIGTAIGTAAGTGLALAAGKIHKKHAVAAEKVLEKRKKNDSSKK